VDFWDVDEMANKIVAVLKYPPLQHDAAQPRELRGPQAAVAGRRFPRCDSWNAECTRRIDRMGKD
jgi:hypothetical protein